MEKGSLMYEGKAKKVYATSDQNTVWLEYTDQATAFNGQKKDSIAGKGVLNNQITGLLFKQLEQEGIPSHFIKLVSENEQLAKKVTIIPLEVVVRNIAAGSLSKRLGIEEGIDLPYPIVEFYYKNDDLGDPLINEDHIGVLGIAEKGELGWLREQALRVNAVLTDFFRTVGVKLIDFKLEFGRTADGQILLADEISPDTCRLWDMETGEKLDKDVFRRSLGNMAEAYEEILKRLGGLKHV